MAYDAAKAALFNKLRQDGLSEDQAYDQAGINGNDVYNYQINEVGSNDPKSAAYNPNYGKLEYSGFGNPNKSAGKVTAKEEAEDPDIEEQATRTKSTPTRVTTTSVTEETTTGGGSRTVISNPPKDTPASQAYAKEADAKQAEIDQFVKDNPSNWQRKRQGLPPLTQEENEARAAKLGDLQNQQVQISNKESAAKEYVPPTEVVVPNTTTTTVTTTTATAAVNNPVDSQKDQSLSQQTEVQIDNTGPTVATAGNSTSEAAPPTGDVATTPPATTDTPKTTDAPGAGYTDYDIPVAQNYADHDIPTPLPAQEDPFEVARLEAEARDRETGAPTDAAVEVGEEDPFEARRLELEQEANQAELAREATDVEPGPGIGQVSRDAGPSFGENPDAEAEAASAAQAGRNLAQSQSTLQARINQPSSADWRVRLQLATGADYLYKASSPGILKPLSDTDGVIFPYTPSIETTYKAKYDYSDLVHSNYKGYFYKSSSVDELSIKGVFTAQDTKEAQYLLAVIHFFRSVTKMFYGKDAEAGTPPPLVYLSAYGQYQFKRHPCVVTNFTYSLPQDVDYIRADGFNNYGLNLENRQNRSSGPPPSGMLDFLKTKLSINGLFPGGLPQVPSPNAVTQNVTNTNSTNSTYVPTKMDISITLLPIQTRSQVSKQFSLKGFANGDLLKGGFW